jgi:biotin carboxyl carrier protein
MKMLHSLAARGAGVVAEVRVAVGDAVESSQVLVTYEPTHPSPPPAEAEGEP